MTAFKAHMFGRRKRGDREEVSLKLFNPDGSPFSGGGSGGPSKIARLSKDTYSIPSTNGTYQWIDFSSYDQLTIPDDVSDTMTFKQYGIELLDPTGIYLVFAKFELSSGLSRFLGMSVNTNWHQFGNSDIHVAASSSSGARSASFVTMGSPGDDPFTLAIRFIVGAPSPTPAFNLDNPELSVLKLN